MKSIFVKTNRKMLLSWFAVLLINQPQMILAANETTHFKFAQLLGELAGLDQNASNVVAKLNLAPDIIYGASATHAGIATSLAGEKVHFPTTITPFTLENDGQDDHTIEKKGHIAKFVSGLFRKMTTNGVSTLNNPEAYEQSMSGFRNNDPFKVFIGAHTITDSSSFHANFKATLRVGIISVPVGHMSNGIENDRQTVIRLKAATEALLAIYIAARRRQESTSIGVNKEWLEKLSNQEITYQNYDKSTNKLLNEVYTKKVNINEPSEVATWFFSQQIVQKYLNELPVRTNPKYLNQAMEKLSAYIKRHEVFLENKMVDDIFKERSAVWYSQKMDEYLALRDLLGIAWQRGLLNEPKIISDVFANALTGVTKLEDYLINRTTTGAATGAEHDRGQPGFGTRDYILDNVVWTYGKGIVRIPYHRFHADYMIEDLQNFITRFENEEIDKIKMELFGGKSKFVENPRKVYWDKVWKHYKKEVNKSQGSREKLTYSQKILILANAIVNTEVSPEHTIVSFSTSEKYKLMIMLQKYLWQDYFAPNTAPGNYDLLFPIQREALLEKLQEKFGSDLISEKMYRDWLKYEKWINDAYNSKTPTTNIQKAAAWILKYDSENKLNSNLKNQKLSCAALFTSAKK